MVSARELRLQMRNHQKRRFVDAATGEEEGEPARIRFYRRQQLPHVIRRALDRIIRVDDRRTPVAKKHRLICRGLLPAEYIWNSLLLASVIGIATAAGDAATPVAFISAFDATFVSPLTGAPICLPHELYVDVVCSYSEQRDLGRRLIRAFFEYAVRRGFTAVRMYATQSAMPVWKANWGFREAETRMDAHRGHCAYGRIERKTYPLLEPNELPTYRLTRVLTGPAAAVGT